ncbi:hypothetical protein NCER_101207 [Vairimorpha ceranae BRL01]|uniref:Rhodanese domain-containing protein n=1 Tax=Vairimorpha ceranae (strain BRL01) TaxID=578460 RepID=C4V9G7_VAIC1|nr:hypothetical protein NCER_101207 [Vairimorpha ceranae BRL01]
MFHESDLLDYEKNKFSRQVIVPGIGIDNQIKLRNSSVLIVGCGGLGSPLVMYLASCGIGKLGIVDYDKIEIHNLQRQIIYKEKDVGCYKVDIAYDFICNINSNIQVVKYKTKFDYSFSELEEYDIVVDCTDNIVTRYVLSDLSKQYKKDFLCASVIRWEGHLYIFKKDGPCYRCLYPTVKKTTANCDENGIIGPICGIFGSLLGLEVIKTILGVNTTKLITYNGFTNTYNNFNLRQINNECLTCIKNIYRHSIDPNSCNSLLKADFFNIPRITWCKILKNFDNFFIIDVRSNIHFRMFRIKGSINIQINDLKDNIHLIDRTKKIVILCKRGISSLRAAKVLIDSGLECFSLEGGLDKYEMMIK